jgi:hypothetical protein
MRGDLPRKVIFGLGLSLIASLMLTAIEVLACSIPGGATTLGSCCDTVFTGTPCNIPINKPYLRSFTPPVVTLTPVPGNPNDVTTL